MGANQIGMQETITALSLSIAKWEAIVAGTGLDHGADNCALCQMFYEQDGPDGRPKDRCVGCPVMAKDGDTDCIGTPYVEWRMHQNLHGRMFFPCYIEEGCAECARLAQAELDFLRSLQPIPIIKFTQILSPEVKDGAIPGSIRLPDGHVLPPCEPLLGIVRSTREVYSIWVKREHGGGYIGESSTPPVITDVQECYRTGILELKTEHGIGVIMFREPKNKIAPNWFKWFCTTVTMTVGTQIKLIPERFVVSYGDSKEKFAVWQWKSVEEA